MAIIFTLKQFYVPYSIFYLQNKSFNHLNMKKVNISWQLTVGQTREGSWNLRRPLLLGMWLHTPCFNLYYIPLNPAHNWYPGVSWHMFCAVCIWVGRLQPGMLQRVLLCHTHSLGWIRMGTLKTTWPRTTLAGLWAWTKNQINLAILYRRLSSRTKSECSLTNERILLSVI